MTLHRSCPSRCARRSVAPWPVVTSFEPAAVVDAYAVIKLISASHPAQPVGVVVNAGVDGGYGRYVEVRHAEGLRSFYAHLGSIDPGVVPGAQVTIGMPIARMRRYAELAREGEPTVAERLRLLTEHDAQVGEQIAVLQAQRRHLQEKISWYRGQLPA